MNSLVPLSQQESSFQNLKKKTVSRGPPGQNLHKEHQLAEATLVQEGSCYRTL
jgi:hypothetical protein